METSAQPPVQQIPQNPIVPPVQLPTPQVPQVTVTSQPEMLQAPSKPPEPPVPSATVPVAKKPFILTITLVAFIILTVIIYFVNNSFLQKTKPEIQQVSTTPVVTQKVLPTATLLPTGTGEAQLDQDILNIDTSIGSAESELTNIEQGLDDQQLNITE